MKVKDLISETKWLTNRDETEPYPVVSVIMIHNNKVNSAMLQRMIFSVTSQSLENIELIIVDDEVSSESADIIRRSIEKDKRISCLTHSHSIGLPAVSQFEAYRRAKGKFIGFAFDDFIFEPDAFEKLLKIAQEGSPVHGYTSINNGLEDVLYGENSGSTDELQFHNNINRCSVLVPTSILNEIGLFDPHVALMEHYDWDLWRRISKRYQFKKAKFVVGSYYKTIDTNIKDAMDIDLFEAIPEFINLERNELLKPEVFMEREILSLPNQASSLLQDHIEQATLSLRTKEWAKTCAKDITPAVEKPLIGVYSYVSPTTSLCFDGIAGEINASLIYILPTTECWKRTIQLIRCEAVIFVRGLLEAEFISAVQDCKKYNIPHYFLIDDNYSLLAKEHAFLAAYTNNRLRVELESFAAVFVSSRPLYNFYVENYIHTSIEFFSAIIDLNLYNKCLKIKQLDRHENEIRIGFMGGQFRMQSLISTVMPALSKLAETRQVSLYVRGDERDYPIQNSGIKIIGMGVISNWHEFICTWREIGLQAMIHPMGNTSNIDYKTANALLVSHYVGALPIVNNEKAYNSIGLDQGVTKVGNNTKEWLDALVNVTKQDIRMHMLQRLALFCERHFTPLGNIKVIQEIASKLHVSRSAREIRLRSALKGMYVQYAQLSEQQTALALRANTLAAEAQQQRLDAENARTAENDVRQLLADSMNREMLAKVENEVLSSTFKRYETQHVQVNSRSNKVDLYDGLEPEREVISQISEDSVNKNRINVDGTSFLTIETIGDGEPSDHQALSERGNLEEVIDSRFVKGWAFSLASRPAKMTLEIDGSKIGTFFAELFREDLLEASIGTGYHAFIVKIPDAFIDGNQHEVRVLFCHSKNVLSGSPLSFSGVI